MSALKLYQCHKRVRAAKITAINGSVLVFADGSDIRPDDEWLLRHQPAVGGYLVFYSDSYMSFSPEKAFEEGYTEIVEK